MSSEERDDGISSLDAAPPEGAPRTNDADRSPVIVIDTATSHPVAGKTTIERWRATFLNLPLDCHFEVSIIAPEELPATLASLVGAAIVVDGSSVMDSMSVELLCQDEIGTEAIVTAEHPKHGQAPVVRLGSAAAQELSTLAWNPDGLHSWLASGPRPIESRRDDSGFWTRITNPREARAAEWGLLKEFQHRPGGLVARYINRPISLRMSRLLVATPVSANMTTWFAFAVGLVAIPLLCTGNYRDAIIATLLLQANSILDGVDGELARIRQRQSIFGAYLDSVTDEILTAAYQVAFGYHLYINGYGDHYLWLGLLAGAGFFSYALVHWHCKWKHGLGMYWWWDAYKPRKQMQRSTSAYSHFKKLFAKESLHFIVIFAAIFHFMHAFTWVFGVAGAGVFGLLFIHIFIVRARW